MTKQMKGSSIQVRIKWADTPTELERKIMQLVFSERARTKTRIKHKIGAGLSHRDFVPGALCWNKGQSTANISTFPTCWYLKHRRGLLVYFLERSYMTKDGLKPMSPAQGA